MDTKIFNFLDLIHSVWALDKLDSREYMIFLDGMMELHNVQWVESTSQVNEAGEFEDLAYKRGLTTVDSLFQYEVNDKSKNKFSNFEAVCLRWMDFSAIGAERREAA